MIEILDLEQKRPFDKLQVLEVGKEKSGKSWCAATAPKPVLFFDYDLRARALSGRKGVYALTFREPAPHLMPTAFSDTLDFLTKLEQYRNLAMLDKMFPNTEPATIVLDSVTTMAKAAGRAAMYSNQDIRRRLTFAGKSTETSWSVDFAKNFDAWNAEMSTIESVVLRFLALPYNVIATIHEAEEQSEDSTPEKKKFTGRIGAFPARYELLFKYFNELWHFDNAPDPDAPSSPIYKSRVQVRPDYRAPWCATNLMLDQFEKPNIEDMIKKHLSRVPQQAPVASNVVPIAKI